MLRRSKQLASLILVAGLGLGVVGCGNKKVDETKSDGNILIPLTKENGLIKTITGLRRSGKSYLLLYH